MSLIVYHHMDGVCIVQFWCRCHQWFEKYHLNIRFKNCHTPFRKSLHLYSWITDEVYRSVIGPQPKHSEPAQAKTVDHFADVQPKPVAHCFKHHSVLVKFPMELAWGKLPSKSGPRADKKLRADDIFLHTDSLHSLKKITCVATNWSANSFALRKPRSNFI